MINVAGHSACAPGLLSPVAWSQGARAALFVFRSYTSAHLIKRLACVGDHRAKHFTEL